MKDIKKALKETADKTKKLACLAITALFFTLLVGMTASAAEMEPTATPTLEATSVSLTVPTLLPLKATGPAADTGIDEVDAMFDNLIGFISGIVRIVGVALIIFGVVSFGIALANHDPGQRAQGLMSLAGGVVVFFAPSIIQFLQGV